MNWQYHDDGILDVRSKVRVELADTQYKKTAKQDYCLAVFHYVFNSVSSCDAPQKLQTLADSSMVSQHSQFFGGTPVLFFLISFLPLDTPFWFSRYPRELSLLFCKLNLRFRSRQDYNLFPKINLK